MRIKRIDDGLAVRFRISDQGTIVNLSYFPIEKRATTLVYRDGERCSGAITTCHRMALGILRNIASRLGPVNFEFTTELESMRQWALTPGKGQGLFQWDDTNIDTAGVFTARKIIIGK